MAEKEVRTVKCARHGVDLPLKRKGKYWVAICRCDTGLVKNQWFDKEVYRVPVKDAEAKKEAEAKAKKD